MIDTGQTFLSAPSALMIVTLSYVAAHKQFLAHLNNIQEELLYYPRHPHWRRRPQMFKFSLKFLRPHYFLTLPQISFIFGLMIHICPEFYAVPSPPP